MKKISIFVIIVFVACAKPEQPPLTEKENVFFEKISEISRCRVKRDIDVMLLGRFASENKRGRYDLELIFDCEDLLKISRNKDSIKKKSAVLVKDLYKTILKSDYSYEEIGISYTCDTNSAKYQVLFYNYLSDSIMQGH